MTRMYRWVATRGALDRPRARRILPRLSANAPGILSSGGYLENYSPITPDSRISERRRRLNRPCRRRRFRESKAKFQSAIGEIFFAGCVESFRDRARLSWRYRFGNNGIIVRGNETKKLFPLKFVFMVRVLFSLFSFSLSLSLFFQRDSHNRR